MRTRSELRAILEELNLTDAERETAYLLYGRGFSRSQIAAQTNVSVQTVAKRVSKIQDRLFAD